jgi:hypothetical protein
VEATPRGWGVQLSPTVVDQGSRSSAGSLGAASSAGAHGSGFCLVLTSIASSSLWAISRMSLRRPCAAIYSSE